jgi:hypothetical protein
MKTVSKRIFFWTLVLFFLVTTPSLILYSMGYRFNPQRGIFVYTGSVSIKSNPLNVEVYVDQKLKSKNLNRINNSYHIGGLKPGEHLIEIKSPGFSTWSKKITVNSGTTTEFWNVLLAKDNYPRTTYPAEGINKLFFNPDKKMIAYTQSGSGGLSVNILDISANKSENIFSSDQYKFTDDNKENMEWEPQSVRITVPTIKDGIKNYLIIDTKTKELVNLKDLAKTDSIKKVRWDQNNKGFLYYISEGDLHYLDTNNPDNNTVVAKDISSYDLSSGYVYFFQLPSGIIYRYDPEGTGGFDQITTSAPDKMDDPNYQIIVYDKDRIALLNKNGELYINNIGAHDQYFRNIASGVSEIQFSDDGKKMLYWNASEIFVYFTRDWEVQPWRSENDQKEIVRFSEKIDNVQWTKDYEHILFSVGNKVKITEVDNRSQNNINDILTLKKTDAEIVSDFRDGKIYFEDNDGNTDNIFSIDFPEKLGLPFINY